MGNFTFSIFQFPANFPSIYLEAGVDEYQGYYGLKDFIIGNTIDVLGRRCVS